jgi:hypothetical protein
VQTLFLFLLERFKPSTKNHLIDGFFSSTWVSIPNPRPRWSGVLGDNTKSAFLSFPLVRRSDGKTVAGLYVLEFFLAD